MAGTITRIILDARGDLVGQAKAAELVLADRAGDYPAHMGVRCDGKFYGICRNKSSLRIYPQPARQEPSAPAVLANDLGGRIPGHDSAGNYSTAQMLHDEMFGGDTSQPLFD